MSIITPNTRFAVTLAGGITVAATLLYAGWTANDQLRNIKDELTRLRADMRASWTIQDMRDYSAELSRGNTQLAVPDPRAIQRFNRP